MTTGRRWMILSLSAVVLGFLAGAVIITLTGRSPGLMFAAMVKAFSGLDILRGSFNARYIGEFLIQMIPITLTGLSVGFAFRAGLFNIGAEGQLMMGALGGTMVALLVPAPPWLHLPLCLLGAMVGGGLWGLIPGWLKAWYNLHEVVVTIMLNYTALHLSNWALLHVVGTVDRVKTSPFPASALLKSEFLSSITRGSRLHWGLLIMVVCILVYWVVIEKTTLGFGLRATGHNKDAARFAGFPIAGYTMLTMAMSGAFAGLAGGAMALGTFGFGRVLPAFEGYGMDGIAVALVGGNTAWGIAASGALFGMLKAAQPLMQSQGVPREIAGIIQASIVLFVAMRYGIQLVIDRVSRIRQGGRNEGV
ncbi:ABC transporter permease [Spirochaeta thermophila]|nr:ABC transporter permease [Spirochaeta thermophila]